jgi:hypothetical protein
MTILLCVVFVLTAAIHAACAAVVVFRIDALIRFCKSEPEAHPVRRLFSRITRREQVRKFGIQVRA